MPLSSMVCQRIHWDATWFNRWTTKFVQAGPVGGAFVPRHIAFHRKTWEWAAIAEALDERGMLAAGRRGCGFAVGREPLACLFAQRGVEVVATDLGEQPNNTAKTWSAAGQHAASLDALYWPDLIGREDFDKRVRFMPQDMRALDVNQLGTFDFLWSSCSFEHLGDLEAGLQFVLRSTELLRPGGVAVHTTEFNVSSGDKTIDRGDSVIYREADIAALSHRLRLLGCGLVRFDPYAGTAVEDIEYDFPPYYSNGRQHVKLLLGGFISTSCLLIIVKGSYPAVLGSLGAVAINSRGAVAPTEQGLSSPIRESIFGRAMARLRAKLKTRV